MNHGEDITPDSGTSGGGSAARPDFRPVAPPPPKGVNTWLLSFTDVAGLMLTFFVMLFSMSDPNPQTWSNMAFSLGTEFNTRPGGTGQGGTHAHPEMSRQIEGRGLDLGYLSTVLHRHLAKTGGADKFIMSMQADRIVISLPGKDLFSPESDQITDEGQKTLYALGQNFRGIRNKIEVHGTAGNLQTASGSSWKTAQGLALARATAAAAILYEAGYNRPVVLEGRPTAPAGQTLAAGHIDLVVREYAPPLLRGF